MLSKVLDQESLSIIKLLPLIELSKSKQKQVISQATKLIEQIRKDKNFSVEELISRFDLSTEEGVAIMCLAEGLLRVPDTNTASMLISDKLSKKNWRQFIGQGAKSFRIHLITFGIYIAGAYSDIIMNKNILAKTLDKIGHNAFIKATELAIKYLGREFVFAQDIEQAAKKASGYKNYLFSFDLLGESARTMKESELYFKQYRKAISVLKKTAPKKSSIKTIHEFDKTEICNKLAAMPSLSVKLTALHPRFELQNFATLEQELLPKVVDLVQRAASANISVTFDAEELTRLDCYLDFIELLYDSINIPDYHGIGFVVQAYHTNCIDTINRIVKIANSHKKIAPLRLVKGAYWDSEIKHAQELGLAQYPVYTKKEFTDASYLAAARTLLEKDQNIYPQFATHNALTVSYILEIAGSKQFELQKLYGMGNVLYNQLNLTNRVRIYAPVGKANNLLAYLMRRLLENGASSSFVRKVSDKNISTETLSYDIHDKVMHLIDSGKKIPLPENLYPNRKNAMGYDIGKKADYSYINEKVNSYFADIYEVSSIIDGRDLYEKKNAKDKFLPAKFAEKFSSIMHSFDSEINQAIDVAYDNFGAWSAVPVYRRAAIIENVANELENNKFKLYALLIKEGGKSIADAINEVIEAIDFCRYYASQSRQIMQEQTMPGPTGEENVLSLHPRGVFLCISPWNFPLAIFMGQVVAALVTGNCVVAKPADQTSVIAHMAVKIMHKAGVPVGALNLLLASGKMVGQCAVPNKKIAGVVFTGSGDTAKQINQTLSSKDGGISPFIAETGGQNAMIVDSSALLEQATDDIVNSAFYSTGQRCSALRILYIQEEIYDDLLDMIKGAMELIKVGDTSDFSNDIGPVIDSKSKEMLEDHVAQMKKSGFKIHKHPLEGSLKDGHFFYPHIIEINSIDEVEDEKFGPILHVIKYSSKQIDQTIESINNYGFGLTFGIHSRIEKQINYLTSKIKVGNIYVNKSIIGAKVESQPFGGEGKSGTGFKAGGPHYLLKFCTERTKSTNLTAIGGNVSLLKG